MDKKITSQIPSTSTTSSVSAKIISTQPSGTESQRIIKNLFVLDPEKLKQLGISSQLFKALSKQEVSDATTRHKIQSEQKIINLTESDLSKIPKDSSEQNVKKAVMTPKCKIIGISTSESSTVPPTKFNLDQLKQRLTLKLNSQREISKSIVLPSSPQSIEALNRSIKADSPNIEIIRNPQKNKGNSQIIQRLTYMTPPRVTTIQNSSASSVVSPNLNTNQYSPISYTKTSQIKDKVLTNPSSKTPIQIMKCNIISSTPLKKKDNDKEENKDKLLVNPSLTNSVKIMKCNLNTSKSSIKNYNEKEEIKDKFPASNIYRNKIKIVKIIHNSESIKNFDFNKPIIKRHYTKRNSSKVTTKGEQFFGLTKKAIASDKKKMKINLKILKNLIKKEETEEKARIKKNKFIEKKNRSKKEDNSRKLTDSKSECSIISKKKDKNYLSKKVTRQSKSSEFDDETYASTTDIVEGSTNNITNKHITNKQDSIITLVTPIEHATNYTSVIPIEQVPTSSLVVQSEKLPNENISDAVSTFVPEHLILDIDAPMKNSKLQEKCEHIPIEEVPIIQEPVQEIFMVAEPVTDVLIQEENIQIPIAEVSINIPIDKEPILKLQEEDASLTLEARINPPLMKERRRSRLSEPKIFENIQNQYEITENIAVEQDISKEESTISQQAKIKSKRKSLNDLILEVVEKVCTDDVNTLENQEIVERTEEVPKHHLKEKQNEKKKFKKKISKSKLKLIKKPKNLKMENRKLKNIIRMLMGYVNKSSLVADVGLEELANIENSFIDDDLSDDDQFGYKFLNKDEFELSDDGSFKSDSLAPIKEFNDNKLIPDVEVLSTSKTNEINSISKPLLELIEKPAVTNSGDSDIDILNIPIIIDVNVEPSSSSVPDENLETSISSSFPITLDENVEPTLSSVPIIFDDNVESSEILVIKQNQKRRFSSKNKIELEEKELQEFRKKSITELKISDSSLIQNEICEIVKDLDESTKDLIQRENLVESIKLNIEEIPRSKRKSKLKPKISDLTFEPSTQFEEKQSEDIKRRRKKSKISNSIPLDATTEATIETVDIDESKIQSDKTKQLVEVPLEYKNEEVAIIKELTAPEPISGITESRKDVGPKIYDLTFEQPIQFEEKIETIEINESKIQSETINEFVEVPLEYNNEEVTIRNELTSSEIISDITESRENNESKISDLTFEQPIQVEEKASEGTKRRRKKSKISNSISLDATTEEPINLAEEQIETIEIDESKIQSDKTQQFVKVPLEYKNEDVIIINELTSSEIISDITESRGNIESKISDLTFEQPIQVEEKASEGTKRRRKKSKISNSISLDATTEEPINLAEEQIETIEIDESKIQSDKTKQFVEVPLEYKNEEVIIINELTSSEIISDITESRGNIESKISDLTFEQPIQVEEKASEGTKRRRKKSKISNSISLDATTEEPINLAEEQIETIEIDESKIQSDKTKQFVEVPLEYKNEEVIIINELTSSEIISDITESRENIESKISDLTFEQPIQVEEKASEGTKIRRKKSKISNSVSLDATTEEPINLAEEQIEAIEIDESKIQSDKTNQLEYRNDELTKELTASDIIPNAETPVSFSDDNFKIVAKKSRRSKNKHTKEESIQEHSTKIEKIDKIISVKKPMGIPIKTKKVDNSEFKNNRRKMCKEPALVQALTDVHTKNKNMEKIETEVDACQTSNSLTESKETFSVLDTIEEQSNKLKEQLIVESHSGEKKGDAVENEAIKGSGSRKLKLKPKLRQRTIKESMTLQIESKNMQEESAIQDNSEIEEEGSKNALESEQIEEENDKKNINESHEFKIYLKNINESIQYSNEINKEEDKHKTSSISKRKTKSKKNYEEIKEPNQITTTSKMRQKTIEESMEMLPETGKKNPFEVQNRRSGRKSKGKEKCFEKIKNLESDSREQFKQKKEISVSQKNNNQESIPQLTEVPLEISRSTENIVEDLKKDNMQIESGTSENKFSKTPKNTEKPKSHSTTRNNSPDCDYEFAGFESEATNVKNIGKPKIPKENEITSSSRKRKNESPMTEVMPKMAKTKGRKSKLPTFEYKFNYKIQTTPVQMKSSIDGDPICGNCEWRIPRKDWRKHLSTHNGLGWIQGEEEAIDLTNYRSVLNIMLNYLKINKKKSAKCEKCGIERRSAAGIISHQETCGLTPDQTEKLKITCEHCNAKMMSCSMSMHLSKVCHVLRERYEKLMDVENEKNAIIEKEIDDNLEMSVTGRLKRKAVKRAQNKIMTMIENTTVDDLIEEIRKKKLTGSIEIKWKQSINDNGFANCLNTNCTFTGKTQEEMLKHYDLCDEKGFACIVCKLRTEIRTDIEAHIIKEHKNELNAKLDIAASDSDATVDDNVSSESDDISGVDETEVISDKNDNNSDNDYDDDNNKSKVPTKRKKVKKEEDKYRATELCKTMVANYHKYLREPTKNPYYTLALEWTRKFRAKHYSLTPLFDSIVSSQKIRFLTENQYKDYLPFAKKSINFYGKFSHSYRGKYASIMPPPQWISLDAFKGQIANDIPTMFCGGPIFAMEWVTFPSDYSGPQYLAVCCNPDPIMDIKVFHENSLKTIVQIWNMGTINNNYLKERFVPKLNYSFIFDDGPVWEIKFCPSGGYLNDGSDKSRLGILAVTSINGKIYLFSLPILNPNENELNMNYDKETVIDLKPFVILDYDVDKRKILGGTSEQVTRISWSEAKGHSIFAAGYSNGLVAVWNLVTESLLLCRNVNDTRTILPVSVFQSHPSNITAISLFYANNSKWLMVGSGRDIKLYDLKSFWMPLEVSTVSLKSAVTCGEWPLNWAGFIFGLDEGYALNRSGLTIVQPHEIGYKASLLQAIGSSVTDLTINNFLNVSLSCTESGDIIGHYSKQLLYSFCNHDCRDYRMMLGFTEVVDLQKHSIKQINTQTEIVYPNKYGIIFCDLVDPIQSHLSSLNSANYRRTPYNEYPITKINKIKHNPNENCHKFYAVGYQSGFIRLRYLRPPKGSDYRKRK